MVVTDGFTMDLRREDVLQISSNLRYPTPKMRMGKMAEKIGEVICKEQELIMNLLHNIYSMYISMYYMRTMYYHRLQKPSVSKRKTWIEEISTI